MKTTYKLLDSDEGIYVGNYNVDIGYPSVRRIYHYGTFLCAVNDKNEEFFMTKDKDTWERSKSTKRALNDLIRVLEERYYTEVDNIDKIE